MARPEISMIKVAAPGMIWNVVDRALQSFGGMGVCQDTPLAPLLAAARVMKIVDGPDEVHLMMLGRMEFREHNLAKL